MSSEYLLLLALQTCFVMRLSLASSASGYKLDQLQVRAWVKAKYILGSTESASWGWIPRLPEVYFIGLGAGKNVLFVVFNSSSLAESGSFHPLPSMIAYGLRSGIFYLPLT